MAATPRDRLDDDSAYTLPAHYYYDEQTFAREREAIFYRTWQYACHAEWVATPGDYSTAQIGEESVLVIRDDDGELRAFYNVCRHRAHRLLEGSGHVGKIVCPYHAWTYSRDGRLARARNSARVAGFRKSEFCLVPVQAEVLANLVFVNLDPDAAPLAPQTGALERELRAFSPGLDGLTLAHRRGYEIRANWKNLIENYSECYHCPGAHPDFARRIVEMSSYRIEVHDIHHRHRSRAKTPDKSAYAYDGDAGAHSEEFAGWYLWPNLAIEVYPGGNLNLFHIVPLAPERSMQYIEWYFPEPTPSPGEQAVIDHLHETVRLEDVGLCESVQRGLRSRSYDRGRLVVDKARSDASEHAVQHFQTLVRRALASA